MPTPPRFDFADPKDTNTIALTIDSLMEPVAGFADGITGFALFDPQHPERTTGTIQVAVSSIQFSHSGYTKSVRGYGLEEKQHPQLTCTLKKILSGRVVKPGLYEGKVLVDFTARGVTRPLTIPLRVQYLPGRAHERDGATDGDLLVVRSTFPLSRKAFGIAPGVPAELASDAVEIRVAIVGTYAKSKSRPLSPPPPTSEKKPTKKVEERMAFHKVPGASVAVVKNFKLAWVEHFGKTGADKVMPINEKTLFPAGTLGGPVAATLALKLVQDGVLALDTDINTYLKRWKVPGGQKVTLRDLLTQRSGFFYGKYLGYDPAKPIPTLLQVLQGTPPAQTPPSVPGELRTFTLASENNVVLQQVLEDHTGKSVNTLLTETFGELQSLYQVFPPTESYIRLAQGHDEAGKPLPHGGRAYPELLASGLWTRAEEVAQFLAMHLAAAAGKGEGVLKAPFAKLLFEPVIPTNSLAFGIDKDDPTHYFRGGNTAGYYCHADLWPTRGEAVVVFANRNLCWQFANELRDLARGT